MNILKYFIPHHPENYRKDNAEKYEVDCPICRKKNLIDKNQKEITGCDKKCVVCYDKNISIFFRIAVTPIFVAIAI